MHTSSTDKHRADDSKDKQAKSSHQGLWQQLEKLDPVDTTARAKCQYLHKQKHYILTMLKTDYVVDVSQRQISAAVNKSQLNPVGFLEQLCVLAYLINSKEKPPVGKLVKAESLPGGQFFFRGLHKLPTDKLEKAFGQNPSRLYEAAERFGAVSREYGDSAVEINILPRVPVTLIIWGECEEFGARASILFDQTAADQLPLDALGTAVNLTVAKFTEKAISR